MRGATEGGACGKAERRQMGARATDGWRAAAAVVMIAIVATRGGCGGVGERVGVCSAEEEVVEQGDNGGEWEGGIVAHLSRGNHHDGVDVGGGGIGAEPRGGDVGCLFSERGGGGGLGRRKPEGGDGAMDEVGDTTALVGDAEEQSSAAGDLSHGEVV